MQVRIYYLSDYPKNLKVFVSYKKIYDIHVQVLNFLIVLWALTFEKYF